MKQNSVYHFSDSLNQEKYYKVFFLPLHLFSFSFQFLSHFSPEIISLFPCTHFFPACQTLLTTDYVNNPVSEQYPIFLSDCISAPKPRGRMLCKHQFRQFNNIFLTGKPFNNNQKKRCHLGVYLLMNGHKEKELHFVLLMNNSYQNSQVSML